MRLHISCQHTQRARHCVVWSLVIATAAAQSSSYTPVPRWGSAFTTTSDKLYVHGGKTDPSNQYSYSSAPNCNDLLVLDLSTSFALDATPWKLLSGSSLADSPQGPALAFHTMTAFAPDNILGFGGDAGPSMPIATNSDSAWLLSSLTHSSVGSSPNIYNLNWTVEPANWAAQPMRRVYHAASVVAGQVWITGGMKDDGSGTGFNQSYRYSPTQSPSVPANFQQLSISGDALPDLVGHASVLLSNGTLLVFGGYSPSTGLLMSFSSIWFLDTTSSSLTWKLIELDASTSFPVGRRNFAYALLEGNKLIIHGGADNFLQNIFSDGWVFDMSTMAWSEAPNLQGTLGPRYDHYSVGLGSQAMFMFGFGVSSAASTGPFLYDISSNTFVPNYTPPSTMTLTPPGSSSSSSSSYSQSQSQPSQQFTTIGTSVIPVYHSTTSNGLSGTGSNGVPTNSPTSSGGGGGPPTPPANTSTPAEIGGAGSKRIIGIAVGTVLGTLGLVLGAVVGGYFAMKRRHMRDGWGAVSGQDDIDGSRGDGAGLLWAAGAGADENVSFYDDSGNAVPREKRLPVPTVSGWVAAPPIRKKSGAWAALGVGSVSTPGSSSGTPGSARPNRVDMLADEDAREFANIGPYVGRRPGMSREGSAVTGTSANGMVPWFRRTASDLVNDGVESVRAIGRSISGGSTGRPAHGDDWWEKHDDAIDAEAGLLQDHDVAAGVAATGVGAYAADRLRGGAGSDEHGHSRNSTYYHDPFADGLEDESPSGIVLVDTGARKSPDMHDLPLQNLAAGSSTGHATEGTILRPASSSTLSSTLENALPITAAVSEHSLGSNTGSSGSSGTPGRGSADTHQTIMSSAPSAPVRRSDSWWGRFGRSRNGSIDTRATSPTGGITRRLSFRLPGNAGVADPKYAIDFRDPTPAPATTVAIARLHAIEETGNTPDGSPDSPPNMDESIGALGKRNNHGQRKLQNLHQPAHRQSASSLLTAKTADSEIMEKLGGGYHVVQRVGTPSAHEPSPSDASISSHQVSEGGSEMGELTSSPSALHGEDVRTPGLTGPRPRPPPPRGSKLKLSITDVNFRISEYESRVAAIASGQSTVPMYPGGPRLPPTPTETAAERREKRRRAANETDELTSPTSPSKRHTRWSVTERPSLFIVNPDEDRQRREGTGNSVA